MLKLFRTHHGFSSDNYASSNLNNAKVWYLSGVHWVHLPSSLIIDKKYDNDSLSGVHWVHLPSSLIIDKKYDNDSLEIKSILGTHPPDNEITYHIPFYMLAIYILEYIICFKMSDQPFQHHKIY